MSGAVWFPGILRKGARMYLDHPFQYVIPEMDRIIAGAEFQGVYFENYNETANPKKGKTYVHQMVIMDNGDTSVSISITTYDPKKREVTQ
jgi:hypothetical protein